MQYPFYILLGLLPSLVWLSFYLKKDRRPEPNSMIIKMFLWGMALAPLAIVLELLLIWLLDTRTSPMQFLAQVQPYGIRIILASTLIPALVEEYLKYSAVKRKVLKNSEFDEPTDAMLYCIIVALGFAAVENLLILSKISFPNFSQAFGTIGLRFLGATLVHALASAIVGYWLALGILNTKKRKKLILVGLTLAILFHSCYNYLIITTANQVGSGQRLFLISSIAILLVFTALIISYYFRKLKKQQSICKIAER